MKNKVLISASLFHTLNDAATVIVPMILPLLFNQKFIIHKYSHIGVLSNLGLMATFFFQLLIVSFSAKFEYKHLLLLSFAGISLSLALITFSSAFASFVIVYLTLRFFTSFYHPLGIALVSRAHPSHGIDFAMGVQSGSGNLGVFIAFISSGYMAQSFNWKAPLFVWAGASLILGTISLLSIRHVTTRHEEAFKSDLSSWIQTLKNIKVYIPGFIFGGACWGGTIYYAPSLLNHKFEIPLGQTGFYLALWIGIGTVMTYLFGFLSRKLGRFQVSLYAVFGATVFLFLLGIALLVEVALASLILFGTFLFLLYPSLQSFVGNEISAGNQAQAFSLVANIQMLSGAIVVLAAGFLSDIFGINSPFLLLGAIGAYTSAFYLAKRGGLSSQSKR